MAFDESADETVTESLRRWVMKHPYVYITISSAAVGAWIFGLTQDWRAFVAGTTGILVLGFVTWSPHGVLYKREERRLETLRRSRKPRGVEQEKTGQQEARPQGEEPTV